MEATFFDKRFVIVAGKGGVGKSTMCAALGLAAARRGKRTIIAELNTREKAPVFFEKERTGYAQQQIHNNLYSINIQPDPALKEYALRKLKFQRMVNVVFDNEAMKRMLRMIPGMNELLLLGKAFDLERETDRRGKPVWDMVIVDAPATGHGISLFRLPQVILDVFKSGPMVDESRQMRDLLVDPRRTVINIVSLAEDMPVRETFELMHQIDTVLRIPKGYLLINQIWPDLINTRDRQALHTLRDELQGASQDKLTGALRCIDAMSERREMQEFYLRELDRGVDIPAIRVPFLFVEDFKTKAVEILSDHVIKEAERLETLARRS